MRIKYFFIGETPSFKQSKSLFKFLEAVGIPKDEVYFESIYDTKVKTYGVGDKDIKDELHVDYLFERTNKIREIISQLHPRVIVIFGKTPLKVFYDTESIESWRGSVLEYKTKEKTYPLIPTFDPDEIHRGGGTSHWYLPSFMFDLKRAIQVPSAFKESYRLIESPKELEDYFEGKKEISFDIETVLRGGERIKCIGFSSDGIEGVVVPFEESSLYNTLDLQKIIKDRMESGEVKWIAQNGYGFDINYLERAWGIKMRGFYFDTMVAHHLLHPELPHDLGTLTSFYTLIPYYKHLSDVDLYRYNALDAIATFQIYKALAEELKTRKLENFYFSYYHPLLTPLREMSRRGIKINQQTQKELKNALNSEIKTYQKELDEEYKKHTRTDHLERRKRRVKMLIENGNRKTVFLRGKRVRLVSLLKRTETQIAKLESINVRSSDALSKFLYGNLGLPIQRKRGKPTTDETAINKLFILTSHPFLKVILKLRDVENNMSKYGNMKLDDDGRVRTTYSFAETGRLRSGKFEAK